ncbi:MAG TPA: SgcJ/EcaC family oxidoreductase [Casimicrobiaceae bacterium]|nr:SgcJ/EcaC family oxidoreductase [Casimicrobiaceae bacterium]
MQPDERAIRDLVSTWISASNAGDTQQVLNLMADDVVFLVAGKKPMRKADYLAGQAALKDVAMDAKSQIQEIRIFGDWAYLWTKLSVVMTPRDGAAVTRAGNTLSILQKRDGKWLLFRDANMLAEGT